MKISLRTTSKALAGIAAAAALLTPLGAFAHPISPPGVAPIAVRSCEVTQKTAASYRPWYGWRYAAPFAPPPATNGLRIVFANRTNVPATEVGFRVAYRGAVEYVRDAGTFSPGVSIDHSYSQFVDFAFLGSQPNACRPVFAKFADGSIWLERPLF
jgi:hypothetical protein